MRIIRDWNKSSAFAILYFHNLIQNSGIMKLQYLSTIGNLQVSFLDTLHNFSNFIIPDFSVISSTRQDRGFVSKEISCNFHSCE